MEKKKMSFSLLQIKSIYMIFSSAVIETLYIFDIFGKGKAISIFYIHNRISVRIFSSETNRVAR